MNLNFYLRQAESRAVGILFLINASIIGNWLVRIPDIKNDLDLTDGQLGLALLASPLGVLCFTPIATWAMNRFGVGKVVVISATLMLLSVAGLGQTKSILSLAIALYFFGGFNGVLDISMNAVANAVEQRLSKVIMSTSHGFWSLGAMLASFIGGFIVSADIHYDIHFLLVAISGIMMLFTIVPKVWSIRDEDESDFTWKWPGWSLMIMSLIALIILLVEGAIADWSALFYAEILDAPAEMIGWGFASFSATMAIARFWGDQVIERFPIRFILMVSCVLATVGLGIFSMGNSIFISCIALLITGTGCSLIVPILFREAGRSKKINPSLGLAFVSTIGYTGFLIGPPMMGFISEHSNLSFSFLSLSILMGVAFLLSLRI